MRISIKRRDYKWEIHLEGGKKQGGYIAAKISSINRRFLS